MKPKLASSFPYVRDWLKEHPFKNTPEARLICNLHNGGPGRVVIEPLISYYYYRRRKVPVATDYNKEYPQLVQAIVPINLRLSFRHACLTNMYWIDANQTTI